MVIISIFPIILSGISASLAVSIPSSPPSTAATVNSAQLSVSLEFFAFPGYMELPTTTNCLANIAALRGTSPAVRIGGTTQDRATYDPTLTVPVNYTVANITDAPTTLTFGPSYFPLAAALKGDVTLGFNRQLNNQTNSIEAALQAKKDVPNLLAIELGNEPDIYAAGSPIIPPNGTWDPQVDGESQRLWFTNFAPSVGDIFQGAVYLSYPEWSTAGLIPILGSAITHVKTFSGHSYPQSACGGADTNLTLLMSHSEIVSYTEQYKSEAAAAHNVSKPYFLGETNSATCGGGGISPTFGAALWIVDYVLQAILNNVDRLYFHQGTIANCQYCFWGNSTVAAPYYGAFFVSEFLGDGEKLAMLDDGLGAVGSYAVYSPSDTLARLLVYNSNYYNGTGTRFNTTVTFTSSALPSNGVVYAKRFTAPSATSVVSEGAAVTIGGGSQFDSTCTETGTENLEVVPIREGAFDLSLRMSEALIIYL